MKRIRDKKASFYSRRIKERLPGLKGIALFGSRARGDAHEGSDYDFAVILDRKSAQTTKTIRDIEVEFLDKFDSLSSSIVFTETEWRRHKRLPIGLNIAREGIWL